MSFFFFFFQAEDGIRDKLVTGVQTCALPIWMSEEARKRLQAIFNASELGAGFQIALSDLEIRGAGNILGGEQSGFMAAVGFDLYSRLLAEAVEERKARREDRPVRVEKPQAVIDLPVEAHLPD